MLAAPERWSCSLPTHIVSRHTGGVYLHSGYVCGSGPSGWCRRPSEGGAGCLVRPDDNSASLSTAKRLSEVSEVKSAATR